MKTTTTNQVRQVLMNELGLTRNTVRKEMQKIVQDAVKKEVSRLVNDRVMENMVHQEFIKLASEREYTSNIVKTYCRKALEEKAAEFVKHHVHLDTEV